MIAFILKTTICWLVLFLIYQFALRKETYFQLNRFYLLSAFLVGLVLPLMNISVPTEGSAVSIMLDLGPGAVKESVEAASITLEEVIIRPEAGGWNWSIILNVVFWVGIGLGIIRLIAAFGYLFWVGWQSEKKIYKGYTLLRTQHEHKPFSFLKYIFISSQSTYLPEEEVQILRHEEAHLREGHTIDVLLLELSMLFFWWHPLVHLYKRALTEVHEYLADAAVLKHTTKKQYGHLLLRQTQSGQSLALTNTFHSVLKNRIVMMTKKRSGRTALIKYLAGLPVILLAFLTLATTSPQTGGENEMPVFQGCTDLETAEERGVCTKKKLMAFIIDNMKYPEAAKKAGKEGKAFVKFTVDENGKVVNPALLKDPGFGMGEEAIRVVNSLPDWKPGTKDGKTAAIELTLPFVFALEKQNKQEAGKDYDVMPVFPTCTTQESIEEQMRCSKQEMMKFLAEHIQYPKEAFDQKKEGKVFVSFVVSEEGELIEPTILRSPGYGFDEEVIRVLQLTNKLAATWVPGKKDEKPVPVKLTLPVMFKLDSGMKTAKELSSKDRAKKGLLEVQNFKLFPSPNNGQFSLSFDTPETDLVINILNVNGQVIWNREYSGFKGQFNERLSLDAVQPGTYFLSIQGNGKLMVKKFVVE